MLKPVLIIACCATFAYAKYNNNPGPRFPPTNGSIWPKPQHQESEANYFTFDPFDFKIKVVGQTCEIMEKAVERYSFIVRNTNNLKLFKLKEHGAARHKLRREAMDEDLNNQGEFKGLEVELKSPCEKYPYLGMDESYNLTISTSPSLVSNSIWGILRGLESWSQLFYFTNDFSEVRINATRIIDYPRYQHRGLLIDTGRHYLTLRNILKTLAAMAVNKMNVLHWHIVDDQSFPYQSEKFPELSEKGAYHPSMVYTRKDIQLVIQYATERGIRVLPEFDVPGHTRSWGEAFPEVLTECYTKEKVDSLGPMDPTKNATYDLLRDLIQEVQEWFPDKYFHVGGDEVQLDCWSSNPGIQKYMSEHKLSASQLHGLFMSNVMKLLGDRLKPIVWQEVFDEGVALSKDTIIEVWKWGYDKEMIKILQAGHRLLFSSLWYLDMLKSGGDWEGFFEADPADIVSSIQNKSLLNNIVGGEACMWGEAVDDTNIIARVWPRASAVAERLWSPAVDKIHKTQSLAEAKNRLEEHACRMRRRGIQAQPPNGPGVCVTALYE